MNMNKLVAKASQIGLWAMLGYELGAKTHDTVVEQVKEPVYITTESATPKEFTVTLIILLLVLIIIAIVVIIKACSSVNKSRNESIEMNQRRVPQI